MRMGSPKNETIFLFVANFPVQEHFSRRQNSSPALDGVTFIETLCRWSGNSPEGTLRKRIINFFPFRTALPGLSWERRYG